MHRSVHLPDSTYILMHTWPLGSLWISSLTYTCFLPQIAPHHTTYMGRSGQPPLVGSESSEFPKGWPCRPPYSAAQGLWSRRHIEVVLLPFPEPSRCQLTPFSQHVCPHSCRAVSPPNKSPLLCSWWPRAEPILLIS